MDQEKIILLLKGTLDPANRAEAERHLTEIEKIVGFAPGLLQVIMNTAVDMPVRQAGAVYFKNAIVKHWEDPTTDGATPHSQFTIHEQDRGQIRASIVDALVIAPPPVQVHLGICVNQMVKTDFPDKFGPVVDRMSSYLQSSDARQWMGALICLHQIVKYYEYKPAADRQAMVELMRIFLPLLYQRQVQLMPEAAASEALLLQKQILKCFYTLIQYNMPLSLLTREVFTQWMEIVRQVIDRPVPDHLLRPDVDHDQLPEEPAWKCKKWAVHILCRVFERYGTPGQVNKEYKDFAEWYIKTFSEGILTTLMQKVIAAIIQGSFVAPRVIQQSLNYMNTSVSHAATWKILKPHIGDMIEKGIFPLMCHSDEDDDLWREDPIEYIRVKFDVFEDYISPKVAAQSFIHSACKKRKDVLPKCLTFAVGILTSPTATARQKDGAIALVGAVSDILLKKETYRANLESMLVNLVFPLFNQPEGFLRARACWVMRHFSETRFKDEQNLVNGSQAVLKCLLHESELPVRVEAAVCLQQLIQEQEKVQKLLEDHIKDVTLTLLQIIRETENDDLANVMQKLVYLYSDKLQPIALDIVTHLAATLSDLITQTSSSGGGGGAGDAEDDHGMAAISVMNTIDTVLVMMEEDPQILANLEPIITQIIAHVLQSGAVDLYEEAFNLVSSMTTKFVPPNMWKVFVLIYQLFKASKDNMDYFGDMMPPLHNFITVSPDDFIADRSRLGYVFEMCNDVLKNEELGEDLHSYAVKLLEVLILTYRGKIDDAVPSFIEVTMSRLLKTIDDDELKTQCLALIISAFYTNPLLACQSLHKFQPPGSVGSFVSHFINQWLSETDLFLGLHDRKMCILGLTTLITLPSDQREALLPTPELVQQILPSILILFEKLKLAYQAKAAAAEDDDDDDDEDDDDEAEEDDGVEVEDFEDHNPNQLRLKALTKEMGHRFPVTSATVEDIDEDEDDGANGGSEEDDEDDDDYDPDPGELTALESYNAFWVDGDETNEAPIDEYITFRQALEGIQRADPNFYNALFIRVDNSHRKQLDEVFMLAGQRQNARESKKIQQSGGYNFTLAPPTFDFGGSAAFSSPPQPPQ